MREKIIEDIVVMACLSTDCHPRRVFRKDRCVRVANTKRIMIGVLTDTLKIARIDLAQIIGMTHATVIYHLDIINTWEAMNHPHYRDIMRIEEIIKKMYQL